MMNKISDLDLLWEVIDEYIEEKLQNELITEDEANEIYEALHRVRKAILKDE